VKGWYIADPKGVMRSPVYTTRLVATDICKDRNEGVRKQWDGFSGTYYHVEECEIEGKIE